MCILFAYNSTFNFQFTSKQFQIDKVNGAFNTNEKYTISVLDIRGSLVYETSGYNNVISKSIDLTFAEKGIYIFKFSNDNFSKYEKIILTD